LAFSDSNENDLQILKASSTNQKYMTEMIDSGINNDDSEEAKVGRKAVLGGGVVEMIDDEDIFNMN